MRKEKRKSKSILTYILIPFCILTIVEAIVFLGTIMVSGIRNQMEKNARDIVQERVGTRKTDLQSDMLVSWTNLDDLETLIHDTAYELEKKGKIDLEHIDEDSTAAEPLLWEVSESMVSTLRTHHVNSVFLILNTSDSQTTKSNKPGLYILDQDSDSAPSRRNQDLLIERGSSAMIKKLGISTSVNWKPNFIFEEGEAYPDYMYKPAIATVKGEYTNSRDLGYWSISRTLLGDTEDTMTYTVPLKTDSGKTYGVLGVGISESYLRERLPKEEIHESGTGYYCIAVRQGESDNYQIVYSENDSVKTGSIWELPASQQYYNISDELPEMHISAEELKLYNRNTPYESERWYLIGAVPKKNLMAFSDRIYLILMIAILLMVIVGVLGGIAVSFQISTPIKRLYTYMGELTGKRQENLPKTNISEIDHLVMNIERLNRELEKDNLRIITALTRDYLNVYLGNPSKDVVKTVKLEGYMTPGIQKDNGKIQSYHKLVNSYIVNRVGLEDKDKVRYALSLEGVQKNLADKSEYNLSYQIIENGEPHYYQMKVIKVQQEGQYIFAFQNVDSLMLEEKRKQKLYKKALEETQEAYKEVKRANVAKTNFLSRMSHDIRTPINGIVGMTHIMETEIDDKEKVQESLQKVKNLSGQLELLINDVLEMSRIESGKVSLAHETFNLYEKLQELAPAIEVMAGERGVELLGSHYYMKNLFVVSSPIHVQRVVMNIMSNAVKYNKPGGTVECWLKETSIDESHSNYILTIKDTGVGMSKEFMKQIFEPFSREQIMPDTTYTGTGLGMAITKELLDMLGGSIDIESEPDVGTTVTIQLPLEISKELPVVEPKTSQVSLRGKRILLVEDNKMNVEIAKYILEEENAIVDVAGNGKEAVEIFGNSKVGEYELILMDIMMPVMNGLEATRAIRSMKRSDAKKVPIIAMTANAFEEDVQRCKDAGMNEHIAKPIDIENMMSKIAKHL